MPDDAVEPPFLWCDDRTPAPGSPEAEELGCICPVVDNDYGRGYGYIPGQPRAWIMTMGCPLHPFGADSADAEERRKDAYERARERMVNPTPAEEPTPIEELAERFGVEIDFLDEMIAEETARNPEFQTLLDEAIALRATCAHLWLTDAPKRLGTESCAWCGAKRPTGEAGKKGKGGGR